MTLVLDNIRSLYNTGSLFRTADALLVEKIVLCGITGAPPNKQIEKVALGAVDTVPFEYEKDVKTAVSRLKAQGKQIVALELTKESVNYQKAEYSENVALVVGNEVDGVNDQVLEMCDLAVDIPMKGRANSLNVATATAVVAYEIASKFDK